MMTKRMRVLNLLVAGALVVILVAAFLLANRASDQPNPGFFTEEGIGIVLNQKGTCVKVADELVGHQDILCSHHIVFGTMGKCVDFSYNNFAPHITDPQRAPMSLCTSHGLDNQP
jgi:hypothetical protein